MTTWKALAAFGMAIAATAGWVVTAAPSGVTFSEVTVPAGIKFVHNSGRVGQKYLPETMGAGGAFADLNGDGWLDVVLINGRDWKKQPGRRSLPALYKNNGNGTFTNVTLASGLDVETYGMGVAVGDYDNDGRDDLYVTSIDGDRLFHNEGNFKFRDVTKAAGISNASFGTSAAWFDYDRDGKLDLFVANYVQWSADKDLYCTLDGTTKSYCTPESYKGTASKLFHSVGGRFEDVGVRAGIADPTSKSLGVAVLDYDGDGWPDLFIANDTQPNKLYRNNHDGTFTEKGVAAGVAFSEDGVARGAMGADSVDYDGSGRAHLLVGNFANQMLALYRNEGNGLFVDEAPTSTVGRASLLSLAFGVFFFDYDLDGKPDIFAVNGHIEEAIGRVQPKVQYRQIPLMFRNLGKGHFDSVGASLGPAFNVPQVGRGAAYGDFDRDGDLDILITNNQGPARLLRNDGGNRNHWLSIRTVGVKSNRDGIGAIVRVETAAGAAWQTVHSGSSYCSQSDLALTFGLGGETSARAVDVTWPSGTKDRVTGVAANQFVKIEEGKGLVK
jgi:enediyne biosynthesis protein E4